MLQRPSSHETAIWNLDNKVSIGSECGPTLPASWDLRCCVADFDRDSHADYIHVQGRRRSNSDRVYGTNRSPWLDTGWVQAIQRRPQTGLFALQRKHPADVVLIAINHSCVNYQELGDWAQCIVDTRNAMARVPVAAGKVWKA